MSDVEKIDEYVDRQAFKGDTDFMIAQLDIALKKFDELNAKKITLSGATSLKDVAANAEAVNKAIADLQAQNAKLQKSYDDLAKKMAENKKSADDLNRANNKLVDSESAQAKEIALVNQMRIQNNKQLKIQAELELAGANSIDYARAKVKELTAERNKLNLTTEAGRAKQAELNKEIDQYNDFIKENVDDLARQKINIGNYPASAKIIVDALEKAKNKFTELSKAADTTPAALDDARRHFESLRDVVDDRQFVKYAAAAGDAQKEVKAFTRVLIDLEQRGEGSSQAAVDLRKHLAELTDQVADAKDAIKALSSDTHSFDQFAGAVNFAVDTTQTFIGALALTSDSEEDVAEATKTLIALQTVANGIKGVATELTTRGTAANKLYAFAQNQVAIAMDTTATAGTRLKAILATIGIGAIIIGIGLLITNFGKLKDALSGLSEQQKQINKINEEAIDGYVQEKVHVQALVKEVNNENTSKTRKKEIIKELNTLSPTYFSNIKSETDLQDKLTESVAKYIRAIELKARAKAAENALVETEKPIIERQIQLQQDLELVNKQTFDTEERKRRHIEGITKTIQENNKALATGIITPGVDKTMAYLIKQRGPLQKILSDINSDLDSLGGDPNKPIVLPFAATKKVYTDELQAQSEAFKKLSENEDAYLTTRLGARQRAFDLQKRILNEQRAAELYNLDQQINVEKAKGIIDDNKQKEFNQSRLAIINDSAEKQRALERQLGTDIINIRQSFIAKQRELDQQYNDEFKKDQDDRLNASIEAIQKEIERRQVNSSEGQAAEIKALNDRYEKQIATTKEGSKKRKKVEDDYARDRAEIEYKYAVAEVKNQIWAAEQILKIRKDAGLDVADQEKQLHDLKIKLSDIETQHVIDNDKKKVKSNQEKLDAIAAGIQKAKEVFDQASDLIGGLISANVDRQKNAIQDQIDDIDKKKEKEIDAINASTDSEQEKAARIAKINATAQANKEALERRQRQLDLQRARFEKARAIGEIIFNTALAIVKALPNIPLAVAAGAIGAAQLAVAIAQPLPRFRSGRKGGPATLGVVGDGGVPEVVTSPDLSQAYLTPATDTVTYLPKNWNVFPSVDEFRETAMNMLHKPLPFMPVIQDNNEGLIRAMAYEIGGLKRAIMSKQEMHFHWNNGELQKSIKNGNDWWRYIQNNI